MLSLGKSKLYSLLLAMETHLLLLELFGFPYRIYPWYILTNLQATNHHYCDNCHYLSSIFGCVTVGYAVRWASRAQKSHPRIVGKRNEKYFTLDFYHVIQLIHITRTTTTEIFRKNLDFGITVYEVEEPLARVSVSLFLSTLVIPSLYIHTYICIYLYLYLYIGSWLLAFL